MHCIQYVAVAANSRDEARDQVDSYLNTCLEGGGTWYDWYVTGGGRWSTSDDPYNSNYVADIAHVSDKRFIEYLETAKKYRSEQMEWFIEKIREVDLEALISEARAATDFAERLSVGSKLYPFSRLNDICYGTWNSDSYFFDATNDTTEWKYLEESMEKGDKNWYFVPVDFHF